MPRCLIKTVVMTSHFPPEKVSIAIFYNNREMFKYGDTESYLKNSGVSI